MKDEQTKNPLRRSVTSVTLGWIAERLKKAERIKVLLDQGNYQVDSQAVAQAIVGKRPNSH